MPKRRKKPEHKNQKIAKLLSDQNWRDTFLMDCKYKGWKLKNIPAKYLNWVIENVENREFSDVARIELWRRKMMS